MVVARGAYYSALQHDNQLLISSTKAYTIFAAGKRVVHMRTFQLDGDSKEKEASLFIVPINVKGKTAYSHRRPKDHMQINSELCNKADTEANMVYISMKTTASLFITLGAPVSTAFRTLCVCVVKPVPIFPPPPQRCYSLWTSKFEHHS